MWSVLLVLTPETLRGQARSGERPGAAAAESLPQLAGVPETAEELSARQDLARERLDALRPTTQPATQPADEAAAALQAERLGLYQDWEAYLGRLQQIDKLRTSLAALSGEKHIQALTAEIGRQERESRDLGGRPVPVTATEEQVARARAEVQTLEAQVAALAEAQSRRAAQLAGGFDQQGARIEEELRKLRERRQALQTEVDARAPTTTAPARPEPLDLQRRRLEVQVATGELTLETVALERRLAGLQSKQDEQLLAALREGLDARTRRLAALVEAQSRGRMEVLQLQRDRAGDPADIALLDLKLFGERVLARLFRDRDRIRALQRRFPKRDAELLNEQIVLARAYWDRTTASLEFRSGDEALELSSQAREERRDLLGRLATLRGRLGETLDELHRLQAVRDRALERYATLADAVSTASTRKEAAERTRLETELATVRAGLDESMRGAIQEVEEVATRLGDGIAGLEKHIAHLHGVERQLRWKRIASRDSGLTGADWTGAASELRSLWSAGQADAEPTNETEQAADLRWVLLGERTNARERARELWSRFRSGLSGGSAADWAWTAALLIPCVVLGVVLHRVARRRGVRLAGQITLDAEQSIAEEHTPGRGLSSRLDLMLLNMLGDLAIPLLAAGAVLLGVWRLVGDPTVRSLALAILGLPVAALTLWRLVHHLFEAYRPLHRPLPCSDPVARHYRWWLGGLILFSLVVLCAPLLLVVAGIAPTLRAVLIEIYKAGFLLLLLFFLARRQRVLGADAVSRRHWGLAVTWIVYPVLVAAVLALLVLQVIGYGALVTFVGVGLLLTAALVCLSGAVVAYLTDVIDRHTRPAEVATAPVPVTAPAGGGEPEGTGPRRVQYGVALAKWALRVVGLVVVILLGLWAWDVPFQPEWLRARVLGMSGLIVLIALVIDRIVFTALYRLERGGRLPQSTANFIRRWVRGVLLIVVVLLLVAVAGFSIDSIWTFLTTLLAMVAIGFVAMWSMLSNILATLVILIWRPFNVGEQVSILPDGLEGTVIDINFMYTTLQPEAGTKIAVPNNFFAQKFVQRKLLRGTPQRTLAEQLEAEEPLSR